MSHFMTISGPPIDLQGLSGVELLPASEAQEYVRRREPDLARMDGSPVFFVHDGSSGTSEGVVGEAWSLATAGKPLVDSVLAKLLARIGRSGHTVRIWYADNAPDAHLRVEECASIEAMWDKMRSRAGRGTISLRVRLPSARAAGM